ncbi:MAG: hypothetical protein JF887_09245 [Candidatus Dormibacteraeota bacterium]|uniref:Photosynthesis system II assembly factor Ycf48/Hcf136-like domain-containing protein n=1 Tax=Candidatus Amunia macphersoniae TaxID=3127014 RepID=A0A934KP45_9BACT|nr:hypothetical protein [Candidatus Dormibacteraeota bacterium]
MIDLTWISDQLGWALSNTGCGASLCRSLASTSDGGQSWHQMPALPATAGTPSNSCLNAGCGVSGVRFADRLNGYLYGPDLLVTHDSGRSWQPEAAPSVEALEPDQGTVFRVVYTSGGCPGPCDRVVQAAPAGSTNWRTLTNIPFQGIPSRGTRAELIAQAPHLYVAIYGDLAAGAGTQEAIVRRSLDGGRTWTQFRDPCLGGSSVMPDIQVAVAFAAAPGGFLAALCAPRGNQTDQFVVTSQNSGSAWGDRHPVAGQFLGLIAAADAAHITAGTAPSSGNGIVGYTLMASSDGGLHWSVAVSDPERIDANTVNAGFLGFEDVAVGRWVGDEHAIWTTHDGGLHWTRRPFS